MANTKISQLTVATTLDSNTQNTLLIIVDKSSGTPVTKQVELQKIDTVLDYTVDKANSAALYANGAFIQANAAFSSLNTGALAAGTYANAAFIVANSAYDSQNATGSYANSAFVVANTPSNVANSGSLYANGAFVQANAAYNSQNATGSYANSGLTKANSAYALANLNYLQAATRLNVSYTGTTAYLFDQYIGNNPTLHFLPGQTIAFDLNYVDNHPFAIRITAGGVNVSTRLVHVSPTGVVSFNDEAQGKNSGVLYWKVPNDLMNEQYAYQCLNHPGSMVGTIRLEPNGSVVQNTANAAFITANTPSHVANSGALYANGAFIQANAGLAIATYASDFSNSAFIQANAAYEVSNSASVYANTPSDVANSAALYANGAFIQANSAYAQANSADDYSAANSSIWATSAPLTVQSAIDRLANVIYLLSANTPIP
jgi:hypothetical protein